MRDDFNSLYKHLQIEGAVSLLNYVSHSVVSGKDQVFLARIISYVEQLHAIYPMISVFYEIGERWESDGVIEKSNKPWSLALNHILKIHNIPSVDVAITHTQLKKQIHYVQNIISVFLSELENPALKSNFQEPLKFATRQIELIPDYLSFKDNLAQLSNSILTDDFDDEFEAVWAVCGVVSKTIGVKPPRNHEGGYELPDVPRTVDDMHSSYLIEHWVPDESTGEVEKFISNLQDFSLSKNIPIPEIIVTSNEKLTLSPVTEKHPFGLPVHKKKVKITGRVPFLSSTRFLCCIENKTNRVEVSFVSDGAKKLVRDLYPNIELSKPMCDLCNSECKPEKSYIVDCEDGLTNISDKCINRFTGKKVDEAIQNAFYVLNEMKSSRFWEEVESSHIATQNLINWFPVRNFVMIADYFTSKYGFSRRDQNNPTRDLVIDSIRNFNSADEEVKKIINKAFSKYNQYEKIDDTINFFLNVRSNSNYINTIKNIVQKKHINLNDENSTGAISSAPSVYGQQISQSKDSSNEHFGQLRARGPLKLRVFFVDEKEDLEFPVVRYKMKDDLGRKFYWSATWPGNDLLKAGVTVSLVGTIQSHNTWNGTNTTQISRCSNIKIIPRNSPIPDFFKSSVKRTFKQKYNFKVSYQDIDATIDGSAHLRISRSWLEDNHIHEYSNSFPLGENSELLINKVILDISQQCGVKRVSDDGKTVNIKSRKDSKFLRELKMFLSSIPKFKKSKLYLVEDAFPPLLSRNPNKWGNPFAPAKEVPAPQFFFDKDEAIEKTKSFASGRLLTIVHHPIKVGYVPFEIRLEDPFIINLFKKRASEAGYNILVYIDEEHSIKKVEPLHPKNAEFSDDITIIKNEAFHNNSIETHSKLLSSCMFVCVTGLTATPDKAKEVKLAMRKIPKISEPGEKGVIQELLYSESPDFGGSKTSVSLNFLCEERIIKLAKSDRLAVVTDESTVYYLKKLGADVITIDAYKLKKTNLKSINKLQSYIKKTCDL